VRFISGTPCFTIYGKCPFFVSWYEFALPTSFLSLPAATNTVIMPSTGRVLFFFWNQLEVKNHVLDFVAITESGKSDFPMHILDHLSRDIEFIWKWIPPRGRSGGIHIKFHLRNKSDHFIWSLVAVYGAAQNEHKAAFLRELVNLAKDNTHTLFL